MSNLQANRRRAIVAHKQDLSAQGVTNPFFHAFAKLMDKFGGDLGKVRDAIKEANMLWAFRADDAERQLSAYENMAVQLYEAMYHKMRHDEAVSAINSAGIDPDYQAFVEHELLQEASPVIETAPAPQQAAPAEQPQHNYSIMEIGMLNRLASLKDDKFAAAEIMRRHPPKPASEAKLKQLAAKTRRA